MKAKTVSAYTRIFILMAIICSAITYLYLIVFENNDFGNQYGTDVLKIDQAVVTFENGTEMLVSNLPQSFTSEKVLSATYQLPKTLDLKHKSILIATQYTSYNCYIDGESVYQYKPSDNRFIISGGRLQKLISLADKPLSNQVTIEQTARLVSQNRIVVEPLIAGERLDIFTVRLVREDLFLVIAIFLLFGLYIVMIMAKVFFFRKNEYGETLLNVATFYFLYAVFLISQNNSTQYILSILSYTLYTLHYLVILIVQVPLLLIFKRGLAPQKRNYFNYVIVYVLAVLFIQVLLVYITDIEFEDVKLLSFFSIIVSTLWIIYAYFTTSESDKPDKDYLMLSFLPVTVGTLLVIYIKLTLNHEAFRNAINIQLLLFIVCQFYYATCIYSNLANEELKNAEYKRLSMLDFMTGLKNRTAYIKHLEDSDVLTKSQWIIFIDLNNLKILNDTYGHEYGDTVIKQMSTIILELCKTKYDCKAFRIGGDEFILFVEAIRVDSIDEFLETLIAIGAKYKYIKPLELDYSIGYAFYDATKDNLNDVINTADMRMYREKTASTTE